ncbi:tyrosine-type recombinase/integrase [Nitrosomonas communis]|uniref:Site-specific recombinase XerD n=1 Tax=Nitrosomonas communis TaxID=44574 RepID=A0A1I4VLP4_9PROT|nr:site-specific integrase [Nitrosomonas communis]SFN02198.1 Site-specific recombinase XerD [Nitrosomonas communis]
MNEIIFSKTSIDRLPLPQAGKRIEYKDQKQDGLILRVTASGVKSFYFFKRIRNGRLVRIMLGRYPALTAELARKMAADMNLKAATGEDPAQEKKQKKQEMTFSDLFYLWLEQYAKERKKTWSEDVAKFNNHLQGLAKLRLSEITPKLIREIHTSIPKKQSKRSTKAAVFCTTTTANRVKELISSVFSWAVRMEYVRDNPATKVQDFKEKSRDRFLTATEITRFLIALEEGTSPLMRDFFKLALFTAARRSNLEKMRWQEIDWDNYCWNIPLTKNGTPQSLPLIAQAMDILRSRYLQRDNSEYVFASHGTKGHIVDHRKAWIDVLERAGLPATKRQDGGLVFHDLRRTLASWQVMTGASLSVIGKTLNHASPQATAIYARLDNEPVRRHMQVAADAMTKIK